MSSTQPVRPSTLAAALVEEVWSEGDLDRLESLLTPEYVAYGTGLGTLHGRDAAAERVSAVRKAFPGLVYDVTDVEEGDSRVVVDWAAVDPDVDESRPAFSGTIELAVEAGRIVASWGPVGPW